MAGLTRISTDIVKGETMKLITIISTGLMLILASWTGWAMINEDTPFAQNVNPENGAISVPGDYREWPTLGTWAHAKVEGSPGLQEYHVVYTHPETIKYYQKKGKFPDGAVLVKELLNTETMAMTTGPAVGHATTVKGWFVLVRDTKGRFQASSLWGDGWGWSLFNSDDPHHTVSKNYKTDCIPCHTPARDLARKSAIDEDKWIYTFGYPVLQRE
ncbi:MAG: cytochrome P460 family protein [Nitrospirae bacterium]|nr:cytochrome P460 family protein [Nitrospirota bacterium]